MITDVRPGLTTWHKECTWKSGCLEHHDDLTKQNGLASKVMLALRNSLGWMLNWNSGAHLKKRGGTLRINEKWQGVLAAGFLVMFILLAPALENHNINQRE